MQKDGVKGSSTEGHVSHVLSARMSSRPMGWSMHGATQMAKLRAYELNGGDMLDSISHSMSLQNRKIVYFNSQIWGL